MAKKRTYQTFINFMGSDTMYRGFWGSMDSMFLAIGGLTAVPQTGEFDLAIGVRPAAGASNRFWRMYALKDNGTAGLPTYYIKVSLGNTESYPQGGMGFRFDFGNAVDGSGNMVGASHSVTAASRRFDLANASTTAILNAYGQSDEQNITTLFLFDPAGNTGSETNMVISWGRTRDPMTGAADGRGLNFACGGADGGLNTVLNGQTQVCIGPNCQPYYSQRKLVAPIVGGGANPSLWISGSNESATFVFPVVEAYSPDCTMMYLATYFLTDMPKPLAQKNVLLWGATRNYMFTGVLSGQSVIDTNTCLGANQQKWGMCIPWEGTDV